MSEIEFLQDDVVSWADSISKHRSPKDAVVKMVSETSELLDAVLNGTLRDVEGELADCFILMLDLAAMHNVDLLHAARVKMMVNKTREWRNEGGVIRRIKGNGNGTG